ncbi:MAG: mandelate racemase/muconate lactonizing enzyme family protein [Candidatus Latescibacteria bacterium]|nr:mandelate racemase/muconate lactonizing enzyme family protein [Candidatus Latescibacterota bacterium]
MKITSVKSVLLTPFPWVLVKVKTDEGITGIGEAYHGAGVHHIAVDGRLTRVLLGQDPRNVDKLFRDMMKCMSASGFYQGAVMSAISGIEMALWDITGQAIGTPIWQLLGGKFRDKIRMYNDCHAGAEETPESYADTARAAEARGFDAIKFDIDPRPSQRDKYNRCISNNDIAHFVEVVTAMREALDPNTDLAIDAHWNYAPSDILKVAYAFEDLDLLWLEDPTPPENVEAMAKVTQSTRTPICTGENFYTRYGFRELIQNQAADIVSPDMAKAGGLLEGRRIADMADMYYIPLAPHNICGPIGTVHMSHVCAASPNFLALEFHHLDNEIWNTLTVERDLITDGHMDVTTTPGLGVTLDEEVARQVTQEDLGFFDD